MKLERELHAVVYWFLGLGIYIGVLLCLSVVGQLLYLFHAPIELVGIRGSPICSPLGVTAFATSLVATRGRYGKLSAINWLIFLAIAFIPLLNLFAIPYYIGKGFWILVTQQKPIKESKERDAEPDEE